MIAVAILASCIKIEDKKDPAAKITFTSSQTQTKTFIDYINRSGNQLVVYDYVTESATSDEYWYIDHKRIQCTVDGQIIWDFLESDDYYWLYGTTHKCFGWLYSGPSGNNTISFFGEHPEFDQASHSLPLPAYRFTLDSPIYDFMYSDVKMREYTRANPDSSPVDLKMNHLFAAFRFNIKNMRNEVVNISKVTLKVITRKQATIDYSSPDGVQVRYADKLTEELTHNIPLTLRTEDSATLFPDGGEDAFHMIWTQDKEEFKNAVLHIEYTQEGLNGLQTKDIPLNKYNYDEWTGGNRYNYDVVFTEREIMLNCQVVEWTKEDLPVDYTDVVVVSDKLHWNPDTILSEDPRTGEVILKSNGDPAECYFEIDAPKNGEWVATFLTLEGPTDAFTFVVREWDEETQTYVDVEKPTASKPVGEEATLRIKVTNTSGISNTNKAKLRIVVKAGDRTIVVENLCEGNNFHEYTLIQNMN